MKATSLFLIAFLFFVSACTNKPEATTDPANTNFELAELVTAKENIETVCTACHSPTAPPEERFAPPLEIAKRNYMAVTANKDEFVEKMVQFILYPTTEQSMLHSDVEQYGLMDPVGFSEEDIRSIAEYIYENELEKPDWLMDE
ncbi:MAG: hypothetical protein ACPGGA_07035 [Balneolaceae bacterium]